MSDLLKGLGNIGGLGGIVKGITNFMPADDPNTQLLKLQSEVSDLKSQETGLYTEIGRAAVEKYGLDAFSDVADRMKLIQANLAAAEAKLQEAKGEAEAREKAEKEALAGRTCPQCGHENPEGVKFCQECGAKLGGQGTPCPSCGAQNPPGVKFCQECGTKLESAAPAAPATCPACGMENPPGTRFCGGCGAKLG
ncbi:MAG: zinc-ribbon domain-containing protein [Clostridium sp.]|nr:zinc-ribbon domain-containing protein [Clostridium sp.]